MAPSAVPIAGDTASAGGVQVHLPGLSVNGNDLDSPSTSGTSTPFTNGTRTPVNGTSASGLSTPGSAIFADPSKLPPVAIVGYACRLPGDVKTPDELWELCSRARSGWSEIPPERFNKAPFFHPNASKPGCFNPIGGYFLKEDLARFDAPFFNLSAQEATSLDPQQRLLLETTFEALESSGTPREAVTGKNVGVFVGGSFSDYELNNVRDVETSPMFQATGCAAALLSNRISYSFDFRGPSATYDTACSSSLVALHAAMQSIRSGESCAAVVGGCHLNILPDYFVTMSMSQLFNPTGQTYAFDHRAQSGFGRGEGVGCVILKPLDAAIRDRDQIRAVIANSGVNQDGRTNGITNPNGDAQRDLIREVYSKAGLNPIDCGFAEMHGTGTKVGDPIEATAVHEALGKGRTARQPLYIGSVKTNVGHLEGASGIVSTIKAAMMLEKDLLLPNTNYEKPNPKIPLAEWNMKVSTAVRPWPRGKKYVSVSNYGFGGTNAHAVFAKAPASSAVNAGNLTPEVKDMPDPKWKLFVLSANDKDSLKARVKDLGIYLEQRPEVFERLLAGNIAYTLGQRRSHLAYRLAIPATSSDELGVRLASARLQSARVRDAPILGFVFTGQGAQWAQMGCQLIKDHPVFKVAIERASSHLTSLGADFSLLEELQKEGKDSQVNLAHISQPACSAVQIGLTDLLASWGIKPQAVVGHSSGEICCAYAAGIIDADAAMALAYHRGQATVLFKKKFPSLDGTMLAVGAGPETVKPMLKVLKNGYATIACINSPKSVTVSGDRAALVELQATLEAQALFNRLLKVDMAYHSDHMGRVAEEYMEAIKDILPANTSNAVFHSSLLGRIAEPSELGPSYWVQNLVSAVRFSDALATMCDESTNPPAKVNQLVELGPHAALQGPIRDTLTTLGPAATKIAYAPTLLRGKDDTESALSLAGTLYMKGTKVDFSTVNFPITGAANHSLITDLPKYPWNHNTRYWHESRIAEKHCFRQFARNDVLGTLADYSNDLEPTWRNVLRTEDLPWLRHHKMQGMNVFPMAGYLAMAMEAASQRAQMRDVQFDSFDIREIVVNAALIINDGTDVESTISLRPYSEGTRGYSDIWDEFRICSWAPKRGWTEHCRGLVAARNTKTTNTVDADIRTSNQRKELDARKQSTLNNSSEKVDVAGLYSLLDHVGAGYGETYQGLENCFGSDTHAYADLVAPNTKALLPNEFEPNLIIHPAFLDQFIQIVWPIFGAGRQGLDLLYMPTFVKKIQISSNINIAPGEKLQVYGSGDPNAKAPKPTHFDLFATKPDTPLETAISFEGLVMTPIREADTSGSAAAREVCFKTQWESVADAHEVIAEGENKPNGHVESNGLTNGEAKTNGVNGHAEAPVTAEVANGHVEESKLEESVVIIRGNKGDDSFATAIAESVKALGGAEPTFGTLADVDATGKLAIVLGSEQPSLAEAGPETFAQLQKLFLNNEGCIWVYPAAAQSAEAPDANMIVGMTRSIRSETPAKIITLGLTSGTASVEAVADVLKAVFLPNAPSLHKLDREFIERDGKLFVPRVIEDANMNDYVHRETQEAALHKQPFVQPGRRFKIVVGSPGALDTLHFVDDKVGALPDNEVEIEVKATGMNFKDIVVSMGQLAQPYLGVECSGIISSVGKNVTDVKVGDKVMAMSEGAYSTYARCLSTSVYPIPEGMSFEAACTIPVVFCTAYYALIDLGRLAEGEKVLIHAAAGGVGQAAIMLAKMIGAEIFATVGSADKKSFLMQQYGLPEDRIFYSRDTTFGPAIRRVTEGYGVDVVLNSLAGDVLRETWDCLAPFGRFIEIGKADITKNSRLEMNRFETNVSFSSVDLTKVAAFKPKLMKRLLKDVCDLLGKNTVQAIAPITTYPISEVEKAYRQLQSGKSMGKLVVVPHPEDEVKATAQKSASDMLKADASYLLIGGTGGLGRSMTKWLASKGAKNIILVSRSATVSERVQALMDELAPQGVKIVVRPCDVADAASVKKLVSNCADLPPIRGVVQGAMVLRDVLFENMAFDDWTAVVKPKVQGSWNLHQALSDSPLDFFIALSSVAGAVGNRGQAAYAAANVFLDAFCQYRNACGLPATSLNLTAVTGVGYLADNKEREAEVLRNLGGETLVEKEVLALLAAAITGETAKSCGDHCITGLHLTPTTTGQFWATDTKFKHLLDAAAGQGEAGGASGAIPLPQALKQATSPESALQTVYEALVVKLAAVLMLSADEMEPGHSVASYGLDSLVAIEIRNWIAREAEANVQVLELLTSSSLMALAKTILTKSKLASKAAQAVDEGAE
ncbi:hypothetical protein FH972_024581 [Carpinus fangiana]|uniref:Uncharacterized protein n=1 Tax=Carpinus fangiana TaxID=176857 RepID=A0A5N6KZB8_9ROSI|nr:hypothetical protein FH972_024581 [Carpinus fangiana]